MVDAEPYSGITTTGKRLVLARWHSDDAAGAWIDRQPRASDTATSG